MDYKLSPSILSLDFENLTTGLKTISDAGAHQVHIDIMDGQFVPNMSMGPKIVDACKRVTDLYLDVHLMVNSPERLLKRFADSGADRITIHVEATNQIFNALQMIMKLNCDVGVAINPGTWISEIRAVLPIVDVVTVMTVNPGFGGQSFIMETLPKIQKLRKMIEKNEYMTNIQVDGGINEKTIKIAKDAGANDFVAGSALFKHPKGTVEGISILLKGISA